MSKTRRFFVKFSGNKSPTILVVDNNQGYRETLMDLLEQAGYEVLPAANELEAESIVSRQLPNLAIVDIRLHDDDDPHDRSGLRLIRRFPPELPAMILTAHADFKAIQAAYDSAPDAPKPVGYVLKEDGDDAIRGKVRAILVGARENKKPWYKSMTFIVFIILLLVILGIAALVSRSDGHADSVYYVVIVGVITEILAGVLMRIFKLE
jgi:two-component system, response regulator, stage 0 sporulation protein F